MSNHTITGDVQDRFLHYLAGAPGLSHPAAVPDALSAGVPSALPAAVPDAFLAAINIVLQC